MIIADGSTLVGVERALCWSVRVIGYSIIADDIVTVIVLEHDGIEYGVNGWSANAKDRRIYNESSHEK